MDIGNLKWTVDVDTSDLERASREMEGTREAATGASTATRGVGTSAQEAGRRARSATQAMSNDFRRVRSAIGLVSAALAAVGVASGIRTAINDIANFEQAMLGLQVTSGATADQMAEMQKQARTLGATSMFSAQQAGEAQQFLAQAGFDVNEILSATPGILQLAAAGNLSLARAADIASNVLGGMQMEVDQLNRVNDVLAATAAGANTNVEQLGQALSFAAPIASSAGVEIETLAAGVGILGDAGLQGSRAGTGLVGVIRQLSNVTTTGEKTLKAYNLELEDVDITTRGLGPVLRTLREANISTADAFKLFGSEAGAAAQILIAGSDRLAEFSEELENAEGTAANAALVLGSGLVGSMRTLQSVVGESILQMGDAGLSGALKTLINTTSGVIAAWNGMLPEFAEANQLTDRQTMLIRALSTALTVLAAAGAARALQAIVSLIAAKAGLTAGTITLTGALGALRAMMMTVFGPVGLIVGAVTLLYTFREELGLVARQTGMTADEMKELEAEVNELSDAALNNRLDQLSRDLEEATLKAAAAREELARLRQEEMGGAGVLGFESGAVGSEIRGMQAVAEAQERLKRLNQQMEVVRAEQESRTRARIEQNEEETDALGELCRVVDEVTESLDKNGKAANKTEQEVKNLADEYGRLLDRLYPLEAAARQYRHELELLDEAAAAGAINDKADAQRRLAEAYRDTVESLGGFDDVFAAYPGLFDPEDSEGGFWEQWLEGAENALTNFDELAANTAQNFHREFGNAFEAMMFDAKTFEDAFRGLAESMLRSIVNALGQMAAQWVTYHAVQAALGRSTEAATVASSAATGASIAAAYAPAAAAASLASFGANSVPAMAGISSTHALSQSLSMAGMAHDGIDRVPKEGTWLLDKGERVLRQTQADKLDRFLERADQSGGGRSQQVTNNFIVEGRPDNRTQRQIAMEAAGAQRRANARFGG